MNPTNKKQTLPHGDPNGLLGPLDRDLATLAEQFEHASPIKAAQIVVCWNCEQQATKRCRRCGQCACSSCLLPYALPAHWTEIPHKVEICFDCADVVLMAAAARQGVANG